ncbi:MAG: hypothetical protein ACSHXD_13690 [Marinosulfonomonas sp.]
MLDLHLTKHAKARMRQRGFRGDDANLVFRVGSQVADDAFLLTDDDTAREIRKRKQEIQQLERLRGSKVIVAGETLVTLYHETKGLRYKGSGKSRRFS